MAECNQTTVTLETVDPTVVEVTDNSTVVTETQSNPTVVQTNVGIPGAPGAESFTGAAVDVYSLMSDLQRTEAAGSGTDGLTVWTAMLAEMEATGNTSAVWPKGIFAFNNTLVSNTNINIYGVPAGTIFYWEDDVPGLNITSAYQTWTGIAFKSLRANQYADGVSYGIKVEWKCRLRELSITNFSGVGLWSIADIRFPPFGNANVLDIEGIFCFANGSHGVLTEGYDTGNGMFAHIQCVHNGGVGIWDRSLEGNVYAGCTCNTNGLLQGRVSYQDNRYEAGLDLLPVAANPDPDITTPPDPADTGYHSLWRFNSVGGIGDGEPKVWADWVPNKLYNPNWSQPDGGTERAYYQYCPDFLMTAGLSKNCLVNPYSETGGNNLTGHASPSYMLSGTDTAIGGENYFIDTPWLRGRSFSQGLYAWTDRSNNWNPDSWDAVELAEQGTPGFIAMTHRWPDTTEDNLKWVMNPTTEYRAGMNLLLVAGASAASLSIVGVKGFDEGNTFNSHAEADVPLGTICFPLGYFMGDSTGGGMKVSFGSSAPTGGQQGDCCYNIAPVAGGTVGWVCVSAGSWKTFGSIEV